MTDAPTERDPESPWEKLRHRKLVQWTIAYVAGAWGFQQGGWVIDGVLRARPDSVPP